MVTCRKGIIMMTGIDKKTGLLTRCRAKDKAHCPYHRAGSHGARDDADTQKFNESVVKKSNADPAPELRKTAGADTIAPTPTTSSRAGDPLALHMSDQAITAATESMSTAMHDRVAAGDYAIDGVSPMAATFAIDPRVSRYMVTLKYVSKPGQRDIERLKNSIMTTSIGSAFAGADDGAVLSAPHVEEKGPWGRTPGDDAAGAGDDERDGVTIVFAGRVNTPSPEDARAKTIVGIANATGFPQSMVRSISGHVNRVYTGFTDEYRIRLTYRKHPIRVSGQRKVDAVRDALSAMADVEKQRTALIESRLAE